MLEVLVRIICTTLMIGAGYYIINSITHNTKRKLDIKSILLLLVLIIFTVLNYKVKYTIAFSVSIFLLNILIYKVIFHLNIEEAVTSVSIFMIILFFSDIIVTSCFRMFISVKELRQNISIFLLSNISITLTSILVIKSKRIHFQVQKFYSNISAKKVLINSIFLLLLVADFCLLAYNWTNLERININYLVNLSGMIIF